MIAGKKILFITPRFLYPPNDGAKIVFFSTFKYFCEKNEVDVISNISKQDTRYIPYIQNKVSRLSTIVFDVKIQHFLLLFQSLLFWKPYLLLKYLRPVFTKKVDEFLSTKEYDMVWIESSYMSFFIPHIREKYPQIKIYLRSHNVESLLLQRVYDETKNPFKRLLLKREIIFMEKQETLMMQQADKVFVISPIDEQTFLSIAPSLSNKLSLLYPTVDFEKYKKSSLPTEKNIVFIGSMDYLPNAHGIQWFVEKVFPEVEKIYPDVHLYIVWKWMPASFNKWTSRKNIILDRGVKEDVYYYDMARLFICPLFSWSGIKIKIINAFACEKAVLSTTIWVEGLKVSNNQELFIQDTPEWWVKVIAEVLWKDEELNRVAQKWCMYAESNCNPQKVFPLLNIT